MNFISEEIRHALVEIKFLERYEIISKRYNKERTNSFHEIFSIKKAEGIRLFQEMGHIAKYDAKEKFYKLRYEQIGTLTFGIHIRFWNGGRVELVWIVKDRDDVLLGVPLICYSMELIDKDYKISSPFFASMDDLKDILNYTFKMYDDFKDALVRIMSEKKTVTKD